jgi:photosystem II stability/assembly factor-like uncharacterized protein
MADNQVYTSKDSGSLWIQPDGPGTKAYYLPCHDLEDIEESEGSITLIQCIDEFGKYKTVGSTEDPPEPATTEIGTYIGPIADWLERVKGKCPFALYVNLRCGGRAGTFETWERSYVLQVQKVTSTTRSGLVRKDEDVPAMQTFGIEAEPKVLSFSRLSTLNEPLSDGAAVNSIKFWNGGTCWDSCGGTLGECDYGVAVTQAISLGFGKVFIISPDNGNTWTVTAADPFAADDHIADVTLVNVGNRLPRIIVANGTTGAGPAEIAYSDDEGANWTTVVVGSVNALYGVKRGALFSLSKFDIWYATTGGYIHYSEDGGATWVDQEAASLTSSDYNYIEFSDPQHGWACGDAGEIVFTVDGGSTWGDSPTVPVGATDFLSLSVLDKNTLWVGSDTTGFAYKTTNGGTTWTQLGVTSAATDVVQDIMFKDDYFGAAVIATGPGRGTYLTVNGGWTWELYTNDNLLAQDHNAVWICDEFLIWWGTGNATTGTVGKATI